MRVWVLMAQGLCRGVFRNPSDAISYAELHVFEPPAQRLGNYWMVKGKVVGILSDWIIHEGIEE